MITGYMRDDLGVASRGQPPTLTRPSLLDHTAGHPGGFDDSPLRGRLRLQTRHLLGQSYLMRMVPSA